MSVDLSPWQLDDPAADKGDRHGGGSGGGGYTPPPGGGDPPPGGGGTTIGDLFGGGSFTTGQGFDPGQLIFRKKRPGQAFFPQRNPTQFTQQRQGGGFAGSMGGGGMGGFGGGGGGGGTFGGSGGGRQAQSFGAGGVAQAPMGGLGIGAMGPSNNSQMGYGGPEGGGGGNNNSGTGLDAQTSDYFSGWLAPGRNDVSMQHRMFSNLVGAGGFDPNGSRGLIDQMRQQGMRDNGAAQRQAQLSAQMNSPQDAGFANLMATLGGQGNLSRTLQDAQFRSAMQNQQRMYDFGRYGPDADLGAKVGEHMGRVNEDIQSWRTKPPGFWSDMGQILGDAGGSWLSRPGG